MFYRKSWIYVAAASLVATILILSLLIDLVPRFHMGDSAIYILTRPSFFIPNDRSWSYGLVIGWLLRTTRLLISVVFAQIILSWVSFVLFVVAMHRGAHTRFPIGVSLLLIGTCEPLGYYWSRSMMTDSPAQSVFVLACGFILLPVGIPFRLVAVFLTAFALISLRVIYFPAVATAIIITIAWLLLNTRREREMSGRSKVALGWAAMLGAVLLADFSYAYTNTYMTRGKVLSTNIGDMEFLVGTLSPLMGDELKKTPLTPSERATLVPLTYGNRVTNTFSPLGLVPLIRAHFPSTERARPVMRRLVLDSIRQHPITFAELVLRQWGDYLDPFLVMPAQRAGVLTGAVPQVRNDSRVVLPESVITALRSWNVRPLASANFPSRPSVALFYLEEVGGIWSLILAWYATFSFAFLLIVPGNHRSAFLIFINSFAFFYMASVAFGANQMVTRYLLPLDVPLIYTIAVAVNCRSSKLSPKSLDRGYPIWRRVGVPALQTVLPMSAFRAASAATLQSSRPVPGQGRS